MKKNDVIDLKNKPKEELHKMLHELKNKLREAMYDVEDGKTKNVRSVGVIRKDIARILTFINEK